MPRKVPGINQGPEIYDPDALKAEYSRAEREEMTRFTDGRQNRGGGRRHPLRILLLDILLLCIIGGIIYPFIVERNRSGNLGDTRCRLELRRSEDDVLVSLSMKTGAGADGNEAVDITVNVNGRTAESLADLTPRGGEERTLRYSLKGHREKLNVEVILENGETELRLNAVSSAAE
jgi:hypothetical protein